MKEEAKEHEYLDEYGFDDIIKFEKITEEK